ncbi:MAG: FkbM family methyltransferase [Acidobacteriia bacterium]|nr:FkbM family methyltransferase [Terriglobia bacterium]
MSNLVLSSLMRSAIKKSAAAAGLEIHKKKASGATFPLIEKFEAFGVGFQYWVADETGQRWYLPKNLGGSAELRETKRLIRPGDRVLEIGSHHGVYMLFVSKLAGSEGRVISVEAHPFNAMVAGAQIALNQVENCRLIHAAASDRSGSVEVSDDSNASVVESQGIRVPAITGDELDAQFGPFTVLKVDVEGYEGVVLDGCRNILSRNPRVSLEVHCPSLASFGTTVNQVLDRIPARYGGTMMFRSDWQLRPFSREAVPADDIVNLFLGPA